MARLTNTERIIELLHQRPGLDDDQISELTGIKPRQQVNQICRKLENLGKLKRVLGSMGKIVNQLVSTDSSKILCAVTLPKPPVSEIPPHRGTGSTTKEAPIITVDPKHLRETLLILPCSGKKVREEFDNMSEVGPQISHYLPADLADQLDRARARIREQTCIDESTLIPAWRRYDGHLYTAAREALSAAARMGLHILILSGGYGVLLADELIGYYNARFKSNCWPENLLEKVIASYARHHRLKHMRVFASETTDYRNPVERVNWRAAGVDDAVLLTPERVRSMSKSPKAQGEALATLLSGGKIDPNWCSSDGLAINRIHLNK